MKKWLRLEEGWLTLALVWAMILVSALAINQANLIDGLHIIPTIGSVAVIAGLLLAKSRFSSNTAHLFSLVYGLFVLFYFLGGELALDLTWRERVIDLVNRLLVWFGKAFGTGTSRDGMIFVIHTSVVYWLLGYTAAWYTFRRTRVWLTVVPTGLVLLSVVYYYNGPKPLMLYMALYIILSLMYVARTHLVFQEKVWRAAAVRYEREIQFSFLRASFLAALVALIVAWSMPTMTANAAVNEALVGTQGPWRRFQEDWTRLFSALRSYGTNANDPYGDTSFLGGPRTVSNSLVMDVYVPRKLPYIYWQGVSRSTYEDGGWSMPSTATDLRIPDDGPVETPLLLAREVVTQTVVTYLSNSSLLYGAPQVIGSDRQMYIDTAQNVDEQVQVIRTRSRFLLHQGDQYQVTSLVTTADAEGLRSASTDYPDWITDSYLQLPDTVTPQTVALAEDLTAPYDNPYDKAIAIRDYLRENIEYNDQIAAPPEGVEPVHYTLFVSQQGYCTYYASAMAIMLRSQGIPARYVDGYAQGDFDEETNSYRVRASDAHTWVEVYFPQYGWIQFEPTASIPVVTRAQTSDGTGSDADSTALDRRANIDPLEQNTSLEDVRDIALLDLLGEGGQTPNNSSFLGQVSPWQAIGATLLVVIAFILMLVANEWNKRVESDVNRSYTRLSSWARWLGVLLQPAHTPYERADIMVRAVPEGKSSIRNLTQQFVLSQFSQRHASQDGFNPRDEWRTLRPLLLRQALVNRWQRWQERRSQQ